MKRLLRIIWPLALVAWAGCATTPSEPRNLDLLKEEIRDYVKSGRYESDIAAVTAKAHAWLETRAAQRAPSTGSGQAGERLALVLDLDETLLSGAPYFKLYDFGSSDDTWEAWVATGSAPAIEPVREVYRLARRLKVDVFFLTGRPESQRKGTETNLAAIGCSECAALIMKSNTDKRTAAAYKTAERQRLTTEGHVIIASVGDQESDLIGGFAEKTFKLPDPFYLIQ